MSVINAMLRGLDERARRDGRDIELGPSVQVAEREEASTLKRVSWAAVGGLGGAALAAGLWLYWGGMFQAKPAMTPAVAASASAPSQMPAAATSASSPSQMPAAATSASAPSQMPTAAISAPAPSQAAVMPAPTPGDAPAAASEVVAVPATSRAEPIAKASAGDSNSNAVALPAAPIAKPLPLSPPPSAQAPASSAAGPAREAPQLIAAAAPARPRTSKTYDSKQLAANALAKSIALADEGRLEEAKEPLRQVLAANPGELAARQMLAQLEIDTGHPDEARALLEVAVQQNPLQPALATTLARLRADAGDIPAAIALLDAARAGARDDPQLHALLGALLLRSKRFPEAVDAYLVALRADPANPSWLIGIAVALEATGRTGDALEAYQRADTVAGLTADQAEFVNARLTHLRR